MTRVSVLMAQIRLRLNISKAEHIALIEVIGVFVSNYDMDAQAYDQNQIHEALDPITREVWSAIKAGTI
jgi:hypothetical protein